LLTTIDAADDVHRNVPRLGRVLETFENLPPVDARHVDVERDRVGFVLVCELESGFAIERDDDEESFLSRHVEQHAGEVQVILDDEDCAIAGLNGVSVVGR
jgi:hypothetical protein